VGCCAALFYFFEAGGVLVDEDQTQGGVPKMSSSLHHF